MTVLKLVSTFALLSVASAEQFGHYQGPGYNTIGANSFSSASASAYTSAYRGAHIPILRYENFNNGGGSYRYRYFFYETGNGISAHESGAPRAPGPEGPAVTAEGGYSYTAPNGQQISLSYTADENGFHPVGHHRYPKLFYAPSNSTDNTQHLFTTVEIINRTTANKHD